MSLIPGQVIHNRYRVIALLSQGGMGSVYEAMDLTLNVRCALKEMIPYPGTPGTALPQLREQFQQEAQLLAELRHPNVPRVTDHFEEDGNAYLVMDFIHGKRLDEIIDQEGGLAEEEVLGWARQLMEALDHCHEHGVIHRDVKPQNVVITWQGQAILVDFGLAKLVDPNDPRTRTVMRGLGTPEYAPPEQYDAKQGSTDARTDVYSLGATMYHALAGKAPPTATERVVNPNSLVPLHQYRKEDVSQTTEHVLMKAMALQPSERFQSIADMYLALFGSPLPRVEAVRPPTSEDGNKAPSRSEPTTSTVLLPWIGSRGLRVDRRLGAALGTISVVAIVATFSILAGRAGVGDVSTATATPTASATITSTPTATATPSLTPTPTSIPPTRRPTRTPDSFDVFPLLVSPSPTPTPTRRVVPPTPTHTPVPPTNTPSPPQPLPPTAPNTPIPTATPQPTNTPPPTATNTPSPTDTPQPTPTEEPRPTPTSELPPTQIPAPTQEPSPTPSA